MLVSYEDYLEDLFSTNHLSGNPTIISDPIVSSSPTLTSLEESVLIWEEFEAYLEMDSILEDLVDEGNLVDPNNDLVDTFRDVHDEKCYVIRVILIYRPFRVTIQATLDKNVKKISISNASLILEDFNPPLYELPFHKEVPGIAPNFEASRAHGYVLRSLELHIPSFILGI
ncbi:hypothetical protein Tco_1226987 [Tanacetum coccineum]